MRCDFMYCFHGFMLFFFFFQAEDGIRDRTVTGVQTCALPILGFGQAFARQGFDLRRHALSLLSNGDLGWIQIANFLASGALVIAFAVGIRRILRDRPAGTWGPWLVGGYGAGMIG